MCRLHIRVDGARISKTMSINVQTQKSKNEFSSSQTKIDKIIFNDIDKEIIPHMTVESLLSWHFPEKTHKKLIKLELFIRVFTPRRVSVTSERTSFIV